MTHSSLSFSRALSDKGIRLTRQRRILLDLFESKNHLTASELLYLARKEDATINRATVYRTLSLLKDESLVDELDLLHLEGGKHFYERRGTGDHVHVGCPVCGSIREIETALVAKLSREIEAKTDSEVTAVRIEVKAVCASCRKKSGKSARDRGKRL